MNSKPRPKDIALLCLNGHLIVGSLARWPDGRAKFCKECGASTIDACPSCNWPIVGIHENAWMGDSGPYRPPRFCEECGAGYPWTITALQAAKEYADDISQLTPEEKSQLKGALEDLSRDSARTPLAASRFKKLIEKAGPAAGTVVMKFVEAFATAAAKNMMGG